MSDAVYDFERLRERVNEHLSVLNVKLRSLAVSRVCSRVLDITAGETPEETLLTLALSRAALAAMSMWSNQAKALAHSGGTPMDLERAHRLQAELVDEAQVALSAARSMLSSLPAPVGERGKLDVDSLLTMCLRLADAEHPVLIRELALALISATLGFLPVGERQIALGIPALRALRKHASGESAEGFVQAAALRAMWDAEGPRCRQTVMTVLRDQAGARGMVARHAAVQLLIGRQAPPQDTEVIQLCLQDPSEHVRQGLVRVLASRFGDLSASQHANNDELAAVLGSFEQVFGEDRSFRVRGLVLVELEQLARLDVGAARVLEQLMMSAAASNEGLLQRAVLYVAERLFVETVHSLSARRVAESLVGLVRLEQAEATPEQFDRAEKAASLIWRLESKSCLDAGPLLNELAPKLSSLAEGKTLVVEVANAAQLRCLERVLYSLGCDDLPLTIRSLSEFRVLVRKGERRSYKLWRALHELFHPAPDKRPGFPHSRGLVNDGSTLIVPLRMAEVAKTSVPGERQSVFGDSWGGFVPRVEDALACCTTLCGARRLVTAFGVIELRAPSSPVARFLVRWTLILRFARYASLRANSLQAHGAQRNAYVSRLRALGFVVMLPDAVARIGDRDFAVTPRAIRPFLGVAPLGLWVEDALQYVLAPSGNTALHLAAFVWVVVVYVLVKAAWTQQRFEGARERIPLSIGGWGSRGKSGTERLKAALFHANHFDVVSKTTGCEAMMILARRGQSAQELFLYRAYDKATIWEQAKVVEYAEQLEAQVFLWECMALQPEFVNILNRQWMKDPVTTITNAYPDHEDVMGPSGEDVARVVGSFIPYKGTVLSSEYQMAPIVRGVARESQARLIEIHPLEAELLPEDLVERFPYQEHPMNIALVLRLAEELGIDRDRALVDIGDHVVPDLGVLKTFAPFQHRGRRVQFSNGMSANERAGFLSNWKRLGFAAHDPDVQVSTWNVAVVNNRADRVPRSRVFAELLATDASVDAIVIIGTNQNGMRAFLSEEAAGSAALSRFLPDSPAEAASSVERVCRHLNIPKQLATIGARLRSFSAALSGQESVPGYEELLATLEKLEQGASDRFELKSASAGFVSSLLSAEMPLDTPLCLFWTHLESSTERRALLESHVRAIVEPWTRRQQLLAFARTPGLSQESFVARMGETYAAVLLSRVFVLSQSHATGDQVIDTIVENCPPGLELRLLGCQNIKGTGLDFVYRCISVDRVQTWLRRIQEEPLQRKESFEQLAAYTDYGVIDARLALEFTLAALARDDAEHDRARLQAMKRELELKHAGLLTKLGGAQRTTFGTRVLGMIEPIFDHLDSVRRRRRADLLMKQLISNQRSLGDTVTELRAVVARQKGGWLAKDMSKWFRLNK